MKTQNFAIAISKYYVSRCLVLIESIIKYEVNIFILCFDADAEKLIKKNINSKKIFIFNYKEILSFDKSLKKINRSRKLIDKIVTSRPIFLRYINNKFKSKDIFLLDSDIYFFSNPRLLLKYTQKSSVAYCEHDFSRNKIKLNKNYGEFNGGFVYVRFDKNGKKFLLNWSKLCKKWCEFDSKEGKFSDQKYLEDLSKKINNLKILKRPEINLAPWNIEGKKIELKKKQVYVNNNKLIFFHFHGLRQISKNFYILGVSNYNFILPNELKKILFYNYIKKLKKKTLIKEYFWVKNKLFSRLMKSYTVLNKIIKNDFLIYI